MKSRAGGRSLVGRRVAECRRDRGTLGVAWRLCSRDGTRVCCQRSGTSVVDYPSLMTEVHSDPCFSNEVPRVQRQQGQLHYFTE